MRAKKLKIIPALFVISAICVFFLIKAKSAGSGKEIIEEINPSMGAIRTFISTTGTVLPKNRLEVKPPVNGRIEDILVREGEKVKAGRILAWMSSIERSALLDAARGQGEEALRYWKETYKAIPLISPIDGTVIVAVTQPGQTVAASDAVIVISDQLIVRAQADETDIGGIKPGRDAFITLDAYPGEKIKAVVGHIYYESKTVNNVTIYAVDVLPESVPSFFRSGMNAAIDFLSEVRDRVLLVPVAAVHKEKGETFVLIRRDDEKEPVRRAVSLGITDDKNYEILSGLDIGDTVIVTTKKYSLPGSVGKNPFMPPRPPRSGRSR